MASLELRGERVSISPWLDLPLLLAMLVLFNVAARTIRINPPVGRRLARLVIGVTVFGGIYGGFFAWCRLVVLPRALEAVRGGREIGFADRVLGLVGRLGTSTIILGFILGCGVIYAAIELATRKPRDSTR